MDAVLLINTGTPDSPSIKDVWRYLTRFLNDRRVISLPLLARLLLVNLIIVPFRVRKSASLYRRVWTEEGSPLAVNAAKLTESLQSSLGSDVMVWYAMRYGKPSISRVMKQIIASNPDHITILPLFPQYASSTTGSCLASVKKELTRQSARPEIRIIESFHNAPGFIEAEASVALKYNPAQYDHVLFSFHGLPLNHIDNMHLEAGDSCSCYDKGTESECRICYAGACHETASLIARRLNLDRSGWSVAFQSRFSRGWTSPFSDDEVVRLAGEGVKRLLVMAPSFTSDCLETIVEVGMDYKKLFVKSGGSELTLVESLNYSSEWVTGLQEILLKG